MAAEPGEFAPKAVKTGRHSEDSRQAGYAGVPEQRVFSSRLRGLSFHYVGQRFFPASQFVISELETHGPFF